MLEFRKAAMISSHSVKSTQRGRDLGLRDVWLFLREIRWLGFTLKSRLLIAKAPMLTLVLVLLAAAALVVHGVHTSDGDHEL